MCHRILRIRANRANERLTASQGFSFAKSSIFARGRFSGTVFCKKSIAHERRDGVIKNNLCPYCNDTMERGCVMSGEGPIKWYPDEGSTLLGFNLDAKRVGHFGFLRRSKLIGYRCTHCDVLIVNE
jgi:hypothetical protein